MARHGGFSAAASITEDTVNNVIATYFRQVQGPYFFPMPTTLGSGANTVTFAGLIELDPPTVELHPNAANLIAAHFTFRTTLKAQIAGGAQQRWIVQFTASGFTLLIPSVVDGQVVASLSAAQTVLSPLKVDVLEGPPLLAEALSALESQQFADFLTAQVRSLIPLIGSQPLLSAQFTHTEPATFKDSGWSVFDWFTIKVTATRVVAVPLEKAITVAVDFDNFSKGDASQLVDLTTVRGVGTTYYRVVTPSTDTGAPPMLQRRVEPTGAQVAVAVNMGVISQIVATQVSPSIGGTPISKNIKLNWISAGYSTFAKPLVGNEDGLNLHFNITSTKGLSVTADGDAYLQPYLQTYAGPTNFIRADEWRFHVGALEVNLPFWADFVIGLAEFIFLTATLLALPVALIIDAYTNFIQAVLDAVAKVDEGNLSVNAQGRLQGTANGITLPGPWSAPLKKTSFPRWDGMLQNVAFTGESVDIAIKTWINWDDAVPQPKAVIAPAAWPASDRRSIQLSLKLRSDLEKLAGSNLLLQWQVTRNDTGATVATATIPYTAANNGPAIDHHSAALYAVSAFTVHCTATATIGSQVGEIWTGTQTLAIDDILDRSHSFVQWGPHTVHFPPPNVPLVDVVWWSHIRRSRIHRTAMAARCKMLKRKAAMVTGDPFDPGVPLQYFDHLGFSWDSLNQHRKILCEYCFFGGPDKTTPFPEDDWFEPLPWFVGKLLP